MLRKRIIGMILATDMADHNKHVDLFGRQIKHKNISKEQGNGSNFIDNTRLFETQQDVLNHMIHACDLTPPTRNFEQAKQWTYLLF